MIAVVRGGATERARAHREGWGVRRDRAGRVSLASGVLDERKIRRARSSGSRGGSTDLPATLTCSESETTTTGRSTMSSDPSVYVADVPCPECGSKRATATPDGELEYECRDCATAFDPPQVG